jgi:hypothetical protein
MMKMMIMSIRKVTMEKTTTRRETHLDAINLNLLYSTPMMTSQTRPILLATTAKSGKIHSPPIQSSQHSHLGRSKTSM